MAEQPPRRNWLKWALIASLGLNLAFVGLVSGAVMRGPPGGGPGPGLWHYAHALPDPYRRDLGRALRASRGDWIGPREALRAQRADLAAALRAEPFEPEAAAAVLARERVLTGELAERGTALLLEQITRMTPDERAAYAEALLEDRHGPGHRGRR